MSETDVLLVEDIAQILRIAKNTIHSRRWQKGSGCPLVKRGKRLYAFEKEFWKWLKEGELR
jgi:hypothetical protein